MDVEYMLEILPELAEASLVTLTVTILGFALAAVVGLFLAVIRMAAPKPVAWAMTGITEFIRNTPLLLQLFFVHMTLSSMAFSAVEPSVYAVMVIGIHYATYCAEVYRAGFEGIHRGQWEASTALNFNTFQTFRYVIIPQMIPPVVPALGNYLVGLFKDTPLLAFVAVVELMTTAKGIGNETFRYTEPITMVGAFFLAFSLISATAIRWVEVRLNHYTRIR
jgi:polar amino acid transport system permease protein